MEIKKTSSNRACIFLSAKELDDIGITDKEISFNTPRGQVFMHFLLQIIEDTCSLYRHGCFTLIDCKPYKNGDCRLIFSFASEPSERLYIFDSADNLLDALNSLKFPQAFSKAEIDIKPMDNKYLAYIPSELNLNEHSLAVLSEYSCS